MDFKDFVQYMRKESEEKLGLEVRTVDTVKNNGLKLTGLVFEDNGTNAYVTLYLNNMYDQYQKGVELSQLVDTICEQYEQSRFTYSLDLSDFLDYEKAQKKIAFKLVNYNQNRDIPMVEDDCLANLFYIVIGTHKVKNETVYDVISSRYERTTFTADKLKTLLEMHIISGGAKLENGEIVVASLTKPKPAEPTVHINGEEV